MNNPFEEIFKRLENIEKMIAPVMGAQPEERQDGKEPVLVKISVASGITGYSVNYLYHLASKGLIPCVQAWAYPAFRHGGTQKVDAAAVCPGF
ncbi:Uncharacterised protein [Parabacteroides distasonis]|jgi:hypothetical protein|nr:Uncharacterised protein [Parabacteroides distasonis]